MASATGRIVALVDMDCFYVQVEQREDPVLKGKPCAVVQYKKWKGGGIIAVGYEARACGVTRQMRGDDAKKKCPDIRLVHVPEVRGKADLTKYREAGAEVIDVMCRFCKCVERASIDEAYLDLTDEVSRRLAEDAGFNLDSSALPNTHVVGYEDKDVPKETKEAARLEGLQAWFKEIEQGDSLTNNNARRLAVAAQMVEEMREAVYEITGFRCSAGVAHNKMLAKLACGINKPNKQTVLPMPSVTQLFETMHIGKVRNLGGKFGESLVEDLKTQFMGDLLKYTENEFIDRYGDKSGRWIYLACRGVESDPVNDRLLPKSIGCGKNFMGREQLDTKEKVQHWVTELTKELEERLIKDKEKNKRTARHLGVYIRQKSEEGYSSTSRSCSLVKYDAQKIAQEIMATLHKFNTQANSESPEWYPPLVNISMSTGKFEDDVSNGSSIKSFFTQTESGVQPPASQAVLSSTQLGRGKKRKVGPINSFFSQVSSEQIAEANEYSASSKQTLEESDYAFALKLQKEINSNSGTVHTTQTAIPANERTPKLKDKGISIKSDLRSEKGFFAKMEKRRTLQTKNFCVSEFSSDMDDFQQPFKKRFKENEVFNQDVSFDSSAKLDMNAVSSNHSTVYNCYRTNLATVTGDVNTGENLLKQCQNGVSPETTTSDENTAVSLSKSLDVSTIFNKIIETNCTDKAPVHSSDDYIKCDQCGKDIIVCEMPEHTDYHFALQVQKEVRQSMSSPTTTRNSTAVQSTRGRKKKDVNLLNKTPSVMKFLSRK